MTEDSNQSAFQFHGNWGGFLKIAVMNLLLTIITLGLYRFWATTREREYLWSQTEFIDERLEWTGTGMELFIGALMVSILLGMPITILSFVAQGAFLQNNPTLGFTIIASVLLLIYYLIGVAYYRALRYRLGRTYWRGIRGGSDEPGFKYGLSYIWKNILGMTPLYLLVPWSMISLWNERWNHMSFGTHKFHSNAGWQELMKRYMLFYLIPILMVIAGTYAAYSLGSLMTEIGSGETTDLDGAGLEGVFIIFSLLYLALGLVALIFYSKYFRVAVGGLRLHDLEFGFTARTMDWILLFIGNIALVIFTLGLGYIMLPYRNWKFFVTHMEAYGEVNLAALSQSTTERSKHGEGLMDAFDVGAI